MTTLTGRERLRTDSGLRPSVADIASYVSAHSEGGDGGYVPVPGSPTKFVRVTHHDVNLTSGADLVRFPFLDTSTITVPTVVTFQVIVACTSSPNDDYVFLVQRISLGKAADDGTIFASFDNGNTRITADYNDALDYVGSKMSGFSGRATDDSMMTIPALYYNNGTLEVGYYGMSSGEELDATIEVQLTSIAPTPRPTTATGL